MKLSSYPAHKESDVTWLGGIAEDWGVRPIKYLVITPVTDGPHATPEIVSEGIPFVSAEAINHGRIDFDKIRGHISEEDHGLFSKKYKPKLGDIYLVKSGATTGRVAIVETDAEFNIWSPLAAIRCDPGIIDRYFLFYYMHSNEFQTGIELNWSFGTQQNIGMGVIENLDVPIPSLPEQQQIAAFLDWKTRKIDALMARKKELLEKLKERRIAVITQAVTRGLNPSAPLRDSGIPWLKKVPAHWETANIRRFATMRTGHTPSRNAATYWEDCDIPWFTLADVWQLRDGRNMYLGETKERISSVGLANSAAELLPPGTVIFSRTASVGFSGIMPRAMATTQDFWNWIPGPRLVSEYLLFQFRAMSQEFEKLTMGSTHKTIYQSDAASLRICVPPISEQQAVVHHILSSTSRLDVLVDKIEGAIGRLTEYRSALISAATTGKIDVRGVKIPQPAQP